MRSHQVEHAHHYVNRLLRSAYRTGAREVLVRSHASRTRVGFQGAALPPPALSKLLEELFRDHGSSANQLAEGANLAFGIEGASCEIRVDDGEEARVLTRDKYGRAEVYKTGSKGYSATTFQLTRGGAMASFGSNSPEYLSVVRRFRLAPYALRINNEEPPRSHAWGRRRKHGVDSGAGVRLRKHALSLGSYVCKHHHVAEIRAYSPELAGVGLPLPSTATSALGLGTSDSLQGLDRCYLGVGLRADSTLDSTVAWVYCGETLQVFPANLPLGGLEIVVDASDLNLDASRERLVQDESFKARWEETKDLVQRFAEVLASTYPGRSGQKLAAQIHFDQEASWREVMAQSGWGQKRS